MSDSIFAVSSGAPPAAIAIIRLSGPATFACVRAISGALPKARHAALRAIRDPASGELLDRGLVLLFPGPDSATGEDLAELHLHGGRAVVRAVEDMLARQPGLRTAEAGEFTRRALIAGRIDLAQAEGLGDLLSAETESQRRAAIGAAEGLVSRRILGWSDRVLALAAEVEAALDFSDEDDVGEPDIGLRLAALAAEIERVAGGPTTERVRDGVRVVLAGPPNSGKSTLFNALVEREAAIVSPIAGTTRDRIEAPVSRGGVAYVLTDTAGMTEVTADPIEAIGVTRAKEAMAQGDIILWLGEDAPPQGALWVHARADAAGRQTLPAGRDVAVSAHSGEGVADVWAAVGERAVQLLPRLDDIAMNARQTALSLDCAAELRAAQDVADMLLIAEHLRRARLALDRITGVTDVEAMLDGLFARFCIGK